MLSLQPVPAQAGAVCLCALQVHANEILSPDQILQSERKYRTRSDIWDAGMWVTDLETLQELLSPLLLFPQYQNISLQALQFLMTCLRSRSRDVTGEVEMHRAADPVGGGARGAAPVTADALSHSCPTAQPLTLCLREPAPKFKTAREQL